MSFDLVYLSEGIVTDVFTVGTLDYEEEKHDWEWRMPPSARAPAIAGPVPDSPEIMEAT